MDGWLGSGIIVRDQRWPAGQKRWLPMVKGIERGFKAGIARTHDAEWECGGGIIDLHQPRQQQSRQYLFWSCPTRGGSYLVSSGTARQGTERGTVRYGGAKLVTCELGSRSLPFQPASSTLPYHCHWVGLRPAKGPLSPSPNQLSSTNGHPITHPPLVPRTPAAVDFSRSDCRYHKTVHPSDPS